MSAFREGSDVLLKLFWRNKLKVALIAALLALLIFFGRIVIPALVIIALGVIASFSTSYKRFIRVPPAVELVTFTTVMVSLAYGPVVGAVYGAIVTFTAEVMTNALDIFIISFFPSRAVIALTAGFFFNQFNGNILLTGVASSILYNLIAQPFYLFMADLEMRAKSVFFVLLNIGSNFAIFAVFGNFVAKLLGIS